LINHPIIDSQACCQSIHGPRCLYRIMFAN